MNKLYVIFTIAMLGLFYTSAQGQSRSAVPASNQLSSVSTTSAKANPCTASLAIEWGVGGWTPWCAYGSVCVDVVGGTGDYTYQWHLVGTNQHGDSDCFIFCFEPENQIGLSLWVKDNGTDCEYTFYHTW